MSELIDDTELKLITGGWDYRSLPSNVQVGSGCYLERKRSLDRFRSSHPVGLHIGNNVKAYTWTEFNVEPTGSLVIGDDTILVGAIFMCAGRIMIGKRVIVSYNVTIADSDFHPRDPDLRRLDAIANTPFNDRRQRPELVSRPVVVEDDVWIGIGAIVLKGVHIGRGARIQAGAVVTTDVTEGAVIAGNPAQVVGQQEVPR